MVRGSEAPPRSADPERHPLFDPTLAIGGLVVGVVVGLTGMGGGALMTPMLMLFFGVHPLTAVSSDLVASAVMKPVGGAVHMRHGTVNLNLVKWLAIGSVPAAFCGVLVIRAIGGGDGIQHDVRLAMGAALLVAAGSMIAKAYAKLVEHGRKRRTGDTTTTGPRDLHVRPLPTLLIGTVGGLVVGMTSVGSGSLIIVSLLMLYPALSTSRLVGTDLVQAVPLVAAAAIGHLLFGDFHLWVTVSLLAGALPGIYVGSRLSSRAPGGLLRRLLAFVLLASSLELLGVGDIPLAVTLIVLAFAGPGLWMLARRHHGLPALVSADKRHRQRQPANR